MFCEPTTSTVLGSSGYPPQALQGWSKEDLNVLQAAQHYQHQQQLMRQVGLALPSSMQA